MLLVSGVNYCRLFIINLVHYVCVVTGIFEISTRIYILFVMGNYVGFVVSSKTLILKHFCLEFHRDYIQISFNN